MSADQHMMSCRLAAILLQRRHYAALNDYTLISRDDMPELSLLYSYSITEGWSESVDERMFVSVFWFLMEKETLMDFIEQTAPSDMDCSRRLWMSFVNCTLG
mgnify:CR=1 FL=1